MDEWLLPIHSYCLFSPFNIFTIDMFKKSFVLSFFLVIALLGRATEGMWIPSILGAVHDDMKANGLKLSKEDLYSVNKSSLKDAIVLFGGGCTAEIVSDEGLLFTNHHCGYDQIQQHSSLQNDYLTHGFWAKNRSEELVCEGLSVIFITRMDDVTARMRDGIKTGMPQAEIDAILRKNRGPIEEEYKKNYPGHGLQLKAFNYGNQYFVIVTKQYNDVRLVGAPPSVIGKFGGDTDNWVWPRHTGDFSVFRIYANKDNEPAAYSADNVPYKPAHFLPINLNGAKEGDFSMVYGFPGRTDHLLTSYAVDYTTNKSNPMRINLRDRSLEVLRQRMAASDEVRIKYASKQSGIANAWKKWKGQNIGLTNFNALELKRQQEEEFMKNVTKKEFEAYASVLPNLKSEYVNYIPYAFSRDAFVEYFYYGPELFNFAYGFNELIEKHAEWKEKGELDAKIKQIIASAREFYKDFDLATEMEIYHAMTAEYIKYQMEAFPQHADIKPYPAFSTKDLKTITAGKSTFQDSTALFKLLNSFGKKSADKFKKDYYYRNAVAMVDQFNTKINPTYRTMTAQIDYLMQQYTEAQSRMGMNKPEWADANSTLRITYGKVEGSEPRDGEIYKYYTTSEGMLQKYATGHVDFELNPRIIELYKNKEFGPYAVNGELRICYTGSNHTTGGNSGSPALDANGNLIGINFDRSWESTMSDIMYNPEICRNIMVDARYVLWVIDIYAGAGYLLDEMKIVK
jgi:hypothetical protein